MFKTTPIYKEISAEGDEGYHMGVYLCLGQAHYALCHENATDYEVFGSLENIKAYFDPINFAKAFSNFLVTSPIVSFFESKTAKF